VSHSTGHAIFSRPIDSFPLAFQFQRSYLQSEVKVNSPSHSQGPGLDCPDCRLERWALRTFSDVHLVSRRIIRRAVTDVTKCIRASLAVTWVGQLPGYGEEGENHQARVRVERTQSFLVLPPATFPSFVITSPTSVT
jgi:hypothetical protein